MFEPADRDEHISLGSIHSSNSSSVVKIRRRESDAPSAVTFGQAEKKLHQVASQIKISNENTPNIRALQQAINSPSTNEGSRSATNNRNN